MKSNRFNATSIKLLTREQFRELCFERDNHQCVICKYDKNLDCHHIIERRLFTSEHEFGGYFIDNGASLCQEHHLKAETTELSCEEIRQAAKIKNIILPDYFDPEQVFDKWGNIILPNGLRLRGDSFYESSVQKALISVLHLFTSYVKYPRTYHLPWSLGRSNNDKILKDCSQFQNKNVVVSIKMDGENVSLYSDYMHARSLEYHSHPSRNWMKNFHASLAKDIPKGWRICGECLFAKHSIKYSNLQSYFQMFSIWNSNNICLNWKETQEWAELLNLKLVPVIYSGIWDEEKIKNFYTSTFEENECEGYVVRLFSEFSYNQFKNSVAKMVRENHVTANNHWKFSKIEQNTLKGI